MCSETDAIINLIPNSMDLLWDVCMDMSSQCFNFLIFVLTTDCGIWVVVSIASLGVCQHGTWCPPVVWPICQLFPRPTSPPASHLCKFSATLGCWGDSPWSWGWLLSLVVGSATQALQPVVSSSPVPTIHSSGRKTNTKQQTNQLYL